MIKITYLSVPAKNSPPTDNSCGAGFPLTILVGELRKWLLYSIRVKLLSLDYIIPVFCSRGASLRRTGLQSLWRPQVQTVHRQDSL